MQTIEFELDRDYVELKQLLKLAEPLKKNEYGKYLLKIAATK